jgi:hypothetical protein
MNKNNARDIVPAEVVELGSEAGGFISEVASVVRAGEH